MLALFRRRLHEIADNPDEIQRMLGNYAHPRGELGFRKSLAKLLARKYGWPLTADNIALTSGSQAGFFQLFNMLAGEFADGSRRRILLPMTPEYAGYNDIGLIDDLYVAHRPEIEERPGGFFKYRVNFDALRIDDDIAAVCVSARPIPPATSLPTVNCINSTPWRRRRACLLSSTTLTDCLSPESFTRPRTRYGTRTSFSA